MLPTLHTRQGYCPAGVRVVKPITFYPGDFQYEQVYSLVNATLEDVGAGNSLLTLRVGLNYKGIINTIFGTNNFRLISDQLAGPKAPSNLVSTVVDSKSYIEDDIKFEIPNSLKSFSIILKDKEDKK